MALPTSEGANINVLHDVDTAIRADSVEWCPLRGREEYLICGTYQLTEATNTRLGCIHLFRFKEDGQLFSLCRLDSEGILDLKWHPADVQGKAAFAVAKSDGSLQLCSLDEREDMETGLKVVSEVPLHDTTSSSSSPCLALSLDWGTPNLTTDEDLPGDDWHVGCSLSAGDLCLVRSVPGGLQVTDKWRGHDLETWICSFDRWNHRVLYSGADDSKLKAWDLRADKSKPIFVKSDHTMGVTSIHSNPFRPHCLATGSYDENVLLWDGRAMKSPVGTLSVGGGIWRLKWDPRAGNLLAAACMHNGVQIIDCRSLTTPVVSASFSRHSSIAYGVDWARQPAQKRGGSSELASLGKDDEEKKDEEEEGDNLFTLASCSFYDHNMKLWTWKTDFS